MKIGISIVGISHLDDNLADSRDIVGRRGRVRKYDCCPPNVLDTLIEPLRASGNTVEVYLTTYPHEYMHELLKFYNPKYYFLKDFKTSFMQKTYNESLIQLKNEDLDFIISTRFDILFSQDMSKLSYDYNKMNVLFREKGYGHMNYTCDNFYAFPKKYIDDFANSIIELFQSGERNGMHGTIHQLSKKIGYENINIIDNMDQLGHDNNYYFLPHA
jgi:hypothetical protein